MHTDAPAGIFRESGPKGRQGAADDPRRRYSLEFKLKVVKETFAPGASVAGVARRHGLNSNLLFGWRKQFRDGKLGVGSARKLPPPAGFVEITQADAAAGVRDLPAPVRAEIYARGPEEQVAGKAPGLIEIETPRGVKLRLSGRVDDRALRRILAAIRRLA
jgi:transposase